MTRFAYRFGSLALLCSVFAVPSNAQSPSPQPPASTLPPDHIQPIRAKQVLGSKVSLTSDFSVGTVDDIVFDDGGSIEYVIVDKDNKLVTVPWSAVKFNFEKQTATINLTPQQYQVIPTYTIRTYPNFYDNTYRTRVYKWYGLTPGQLRRIDRRR
ncbi:MAG TPA: PRC-barrel domain-containing protein [Fimbriiglobus sp.]|jgi:hypothetical protein